MAFTVKYRQFAVSDTQSSAPDAPTMFALQERLDGPFDSVSTRYEGGNLVVTACRGDCSPGMTYGPVTAPDAPNTPPRPTLWVMNEAGATVAKYDL